jgi:PhnB protein
MMQINAYLHFNGDCEAAFKFYAQCLRGKITAMMTIAGTPMEAHTPPERHGKIIHARLEVGEAALMGADAPPDRYKAAQGYTVSLVLDDVAEAERIFAVLAEGGAVQMAIQETFWAARFGMLVDKFGTPWMINCNKPA